MKRFARLICCISAAASTVAPLEAVAQAFPAKAIRVVVPFTPGGAVDLLGRLVAQTMSPALGQPVVVENRDGAGGRIGSAAVARSAPDGYTILLGTTSTHLASVFLSKNMPYDPIKDFTPITDAVDPVHCLVVNPSVPASTVKELVEYARRNPGKLSYGSNGVGSYYHLTGELFKMAASVDMLHVPYKGAAPAVSAMLRGELAVMFGPLTVVMPHVQSGKMRLLGVTRPFRSQPAIAVVGESLPGFEPLPSWLGYFGAQGLPQSVLARLHAEIVKALNASDVREKLAQAGLVVIGNTPEEFAAEIKSGFQAYARIVKAAGIEPE